MFRGERREESGDAEQRKETNRKIEERETGEGIDLKGFLKEKLDKDLSKVEEDEGGKTLRYTFSIKKEKRGEGNRKGE